MILKLISNSQDLIWVWELFLEDLSQALIGEWELFLGTSHKLLLGSENCSLGPLTSSYSGVRIVPWDLSQALIVLHCSLGPIALLLDFSCVLMFVPLMFLLKSFYIVIQLLLHYCSIYYFYYFYHLFYHFCNLKNISLKINWTFDN